MNTRRTHCHSYRHGRAGAFPGRGGNFPEAVFWSCIRLGAFPHWWPSRRAPRAPTVTPPRAVRGDLLWG